MLALLGAGLAAALAPETLRRLQALVPDGSSSLPAADAAEEAVSADSPALPPIPAAVSGRAVVLSSASPATGRVAITIDDGTDPAVVAAYVAFAERTSLHLTFSPNGSLPTWARHADRLRPLIAAGRVQIANHTWSHKNLAHLSDAMVTKEIERNEAWIQSTFGVTARPWLRPPYGVHSRRIDDLAARAGFTHIVLWNGSFGDSAVLDERELVELARRYLQAGGVVLGHANHPAVTRLFPQIEAIINDRGLSAVTLDELFGTSRTTG